MKKKMFGLGLDEIEIPEAGMDFEIPYHTAITAHNENGSKITSRLMRDKKLIDVDAIHFLEQEEFPSIQNKPNDEMRIRVKCAIAIAQGMEPMEKAQTVYRGVDYNYYKDIIDGQRTFIDDTGFTCTAKTTNMASKFPVHYTDDRPYKVLLEINCPKGTLHTEDGTAKSEQEILLAPYRYKVTGISNDFILGETTCFGKHVPPEPASSIWSNRPIRVIHLEPVKQLNAFEILANAVEEAKILAGNGEIKYRPDEKQEIKKSIWDSQRNMINSKLREHKEKVKAEPMTAA